MRVVLLITLLAVAVGVTVAGAAPDPLSPEDKGKTWAVLVAGTNKFSNYRHQAEICHAYQILKRRGVNATNIITMMYNDVAVSPFFKEDDELARGMLTFKARQWSTRWPETSSLGLLLLIDLTDPDNKITRGVFSQKPLIEGWLNRYFRNPVASELVNVEGGPNLYPGVVIDYAGENVTVQNFINVITGNKEAMAGIGSGRILQSGLDDHVLIIYVGRGGVNCIVFPDSVMTGEQLVSALHTMSNKQMFDKLLLFLETCKAGTLFMDILPRDINVLAMTACTYVSRWSESRQVWLADDFTASYLEEIESTDGHKNGSSHTLGKLFRDVSARLALDGMQPARYGQDEMRRDKVQAFFGVSSKQGATRVATAWSDQQKLYSSDEATFQTLKNQFFNAQSSEESEYLMKEINRIIKGRSLIDTLFERLVLRTAPPYQHDIIRTTQQPLMPHARPSYAVLINNFQAKCVNISENLYTLEHVHKLSNLCWAGVPAATVLRAFQAECGPRHRTLVGID